MTFVQFLFRISPLFSITVHGNSMEPTIKNGKRLFVLKYIWTKPCVGDVVVCVHPSTKKKLIKRIMKIHRQTLWIEGDNTTESTDSRSFGWVTRRALIGKVLVK